jgi:hypothetical protein
MKTLASLIAMALVSTSALAAEVGVSVEVGEPGFYGRIDIGNAPRPLLIYPEPMIVVPAHRVYAPVYMRVPPGHARNWKRYCGRYGACGRPVYFVQDSWYHDVYAPHYRKQHPHKGNGKGHGK